MHQWAQRTGKQTCAYTSNRGDGQSCYLFLVSSSLLLYVTCAISSQSSLLDPLDHPHWSLFSNHQLTPVSRSQNALFCHAAPQLWNKLSPTLHLPCPSSIVMLLSRTSRFLTLSTVFLKPFYSYIVSIHSHLSIPETDLLEFYHSVFGSHWLQ